MIQKMYFWPFSFLEAKKLKSLNHTDNILELYNEQPIIIDN